MPRISKLQAPRVPGKLGIFLFSGLVSRILAFETGQLGRFTEKTAGWKTVYGLFEYALLAGC